MSRLTDYQINKLQRAFKRADADAEEMERLAPLMLQALAELRVLREATTRIVELTPDNCTHNREIDPDTGVCADCGTVLP